MSITFFIQDGNEYVDANCPELIEVEPAEDGYPEFRHYPYEVNLSNGNAVTIMSTLGIDAECCGEIDPQVLIEAIQRTPAECGVRAGHEDKVPGGPTIISCGIDVDYVRMRFRTLLEIAVEARRRGRLVFWG
jgi:hypothetical protein